ncbi:ribokinase [Lacrimispora sp.]|jgi:ribokinase|uniref:ribokinase n=1 Tax=Lacrimispora sp. TaxID=2719234 RepID=UPI0028979C0D|nr:ribokinase [Lacrimispora sp.]
MKLLNFGSMNIDYVYKVEHFVRKGETISSDYLNVFSGGKGLNQSIALARAGEEVYHAGAIGNEGEFLLEILNQAGVDTGCVAIRDEVQTGHAMIQNDSEGDNCIILFGGANQRIGKEQVEAVLSGFCAGDLVVLQNEISELGYIISRAHEIGMTIVLNPSPMDLKVLELPLNLVDYFLVNEVEAASLAETSGESDEVVLVKLAAKFPDAKIVMTLGEKGSVYWDGKQIYRQEAVKVIAVDTTAAGDTYTGYFISGIMRGEKIEDVLRLASVASAIAVTRPGAALSIPERKEVEETVKNKREGR